MDEMASEITYKFESGRALTPTPENQPLGQLLTDFTCGVVKSLDENNIVIVGGESRLGKTKLFLGSQAYINAGGLAEHLTKQGRSFVYVDASTKDYTASVLNRILTAKKDKPEVILIDESMALINSSDIISKLLKDGRKVVLVCGGLKSATEQNAAIRKELETSDMNINDNQVFEFPPLILNKLQCRQLLKFRYRGISDEEANNIFTALNLHEIPRTFGAVSNSKKNPSEIDKATMANFIRGIKSVVNT